MTTSPFIFLHPEGWKDPIGYKYGAISDDGAVWTIQLGGVTGMDATQGDVITDPGDIVAQCGKAFESIKLLMANAASVLSVEVGPEHIFGFLIYTTMMGSYRHHIRAIGTEYRRVFGKNFAPTALLGASALFNQDALVEFWVTLKVQK